MQTGIEHGAAHLAIAQAHAVYGLRRQIEELRATLTSAADQLLDDDWRHARALDALAACDEELQAALPMVDAAASQLTRSLLWMAEPDVRVTPGADAISQDKPDPDDWKH